MVGTIDYIKESLSKGYALTKSKAERIFKSLLTIYAMVYGISILEMAIIGTMAYLIVGIPLADSLSLASGKGIASYADLIGKLIILAAVSLPIILIELVLGAAIGSVSLNVIEDASLGKDTDLKAQFMKNLMPILKITLVRWAIYILFALPLAALYLVGGYNAIIAICIFAIILALAFFALMFAIQFSLYELILGGRGVIDSMKASASLVKRNIFSVLLLNVIFLFLGFAVGAVLGIFRMVLNPMLSMASAGGMAMMVAGYLVYFTLIMAANALVMSAMGTITMPIAYNFWKGLRG
jgi:hypothetical protein